MYGDYRDVVGFLKERDGEVARYMGKELERQRKNIELIASENFVSPAVMAAMGSILTNKYAEGYPGNRFYGGCQYIDQIENLAKSRLCELFGAEKANVQPHSGSQANAAAYFAFCDYGDTIMGMHLNEGGHLTHGSTANFSGKAYNFVSYGVDPETGLIDYEKVREKALECRPKMIVAGASAYPRAIDFSIFRDICDEVGAYLMVDMAHIAGLVAAGIHMSPIPYADVVTSTTHKTLRGPRGGIILTKDKYARAVDKAIFPGTQGGPLEHVIAGKAVCFGEALKPEFREYQKKIVENAATLADALKAKGFNLVTGGTDNHLMMLDLRGTGLTGKELEHRLDTVNITANKNMIPGDPETPFITSGIRLGTPAVTTRGMGKEEMESIADFIWRTAYNYEEECDEIHDEVKAICEKFPLYMD